MKGKRPLPFKNSGTIAEKLQLGPKERTLFFESTHNSKIQLDQIKISKDDQRLMLDESYASVIAEWEHFAVLTLLDLDKFKATRGQISKRLNLSRSRTEVVLGNLERCGLIKLENNKYIKCQTNVRTTEDVSSMALRKAHHEILDMGHAKIDGIKVQRRDFSSAMYAVDPEQILQAKVLIREFREKMSQFFKTSTKKSEVYQLSIQLYPLSEEISGSSK
jgi:uncharacterized protein (TIGR02147 family)